MKLVFSENNPATFNGMASLFIEMGWEAAGVPSLEVIVEKLCQDEYQAVVLDDALGPYKVLDTIDWIKDDEFQQNLHIFLHLKAPERNFVLKAVSMGVSGILLKPFHAEKFQPRFAKLLEGLPIGSEKRKHIRVSLEASDAATISFRDPDRNLVQGKVVNLSMGGLLLAADDLSMAEAIRVPCAVKKAHLRFKGFSMIADGLLVALDGVHIALKFSEIPVRDRENLSHFIFEKLNAGS